MHKLILPTALLCFAAQAAFAQVLPFGEPLTPEADTITQQFADFFAQEEMPENLHTDGFELNIRILERYTDTTQDFSINAQDAIIYQNELLVRAESCVTDFDEIPGNDGGYLTVENRMGDKLFKGWVFKSFPSLTTFEHPDYDILVLGCSVN